MNGKHYNRAIKAHKIMVEAMKRLHWGEFVKWLEDEGYEYRLDGLNSSLLELLSEIEYTRQLDEIDQPRVEEKTKVFSTLFQISSF